MCLLLCRGLPVWCGLPSAHNLTYLLVTLGLLQSPFGH